MLVYSSNRTCRQHNLSSDTHYETKRRSKPSRWCWTLKPDPHDPGLANKAMWYLNWSYHTCNAPATPALPT